MRPLIQATDLHVAFGPTRVFEGASFVLHRGDKVALVGPNGAGKTTLFRLLTGQLQPDLGTLDVQEDLRVAYLPQVPEIPPATRVADLLAGPSARAARLAGDVEALEQWMAEPDAWDRPDVQERMARYAELQTQLGEERSKASAIGSPLMNDLGLPDNILDATFGSLSGGERSKVLLCKALGAAKEADLLLLDEPTNHMDIPTVEFIEQFLMDLQAAVVVSAHDRYLLDNVARRVFEVDHRRVESYAGNFSSYVAQREALQRAIAAKKKRQFDEVKRQLAIIQDLQSRNRFTQVKSRRRLIAEHEKAIGAAPTKRKGFRLLFDTDTPPNDVISFHGVAKRFGERILFHGVDLDIRGGDKVGIIGPNGSGKTTLLAILAGRLAVDEGTVTTAPGVSIGYFDQHHETLDPERTLIEEARSLRDPPPPDEWTRGLLGRFRFSGDAVFKKVSQLSGGERARLALAKFIVERHNTLVLDEPTNHLDIESQEVVAGALREYEGTVIVVSHNRSFLDDVCTKTLVLAHREVGLFMGSFSDAAATKRMAEFAGGGIQGRFIVRSAFRDWERDERFHAGQVIEVTGMESQSFRRLLRVAEDEGRIERV
jgi:ATP-binding cassette subfamily F protein 3